MWTFHWLLQILTLTTVSITSPLQVTSVRRPESIILARRYFQEQLLKRRTTRAHSAVSSLKTGRRWLVGGQISCGRYGYCPSQLTIEAAHKALCNMHVFF